MNFTFSNSFAHSKLKHTPKLLNNTKVDEPPKIIPHQLLKYNMIGRVQNYSPCKSCGK